MGSAENLVGTKVKGNRTKLEWEVLEPLSVEPTHTPGHFSVGYRVRASDGTIAFMKASDLSMASQSEDPVKALLEATTAHEFERSVLEHCRGNRLDKIVTAIDSGSQEIIFDGIRDLVFFIIFELANGDLRKFVEIQEGNDLIWITSAIHNFTVAVNQLHNAEIFHNDFKPANALVFNDTEKVADLGRATSPTFPVAHELLLCAGDRRFAPPEQLYHVQNDITSINKYLKARAGDLYNLGSIAHYLITKRMLTPEIVIRLDGAFRPRTADGGWCDSYNAALPYWRQVFGNVMTEFYDDLPESWLGELKFALDEIKTVILHLCEPDFCLRGDLKPSEVAASKFGLQRIISRMDNVRNRLMVLNRAR